MGGHGRSSSKPKYLLWLIIFLIGMFIFLFFSIWKNKEFWKGAVASDDISMTLKTEKNQGLPIDVKACPSVATTTTASASESTAAMKFMHILIPTVSRAALPPSVNYLTPTIESLMGQLQRNEGDVFSVPHQVQVWLVNHNSVQTPHIHFESLKEQYKGLIQFVSSIPSERHISDKKARIYQQTVDFLWSIKYLFNQNKVNPARYVLFMEDDFTLCDNGMFAMQYLIAKASDYYPKWVSLRVSYGLNGVIVKTSELPDIITYYEKNIQMYGKDLPLPPDHMIYYYAEEQRGLDQNRLLVAYRSNLFSHIGDVSTFTGREKRYNPNCHQVLYDWLQDGERFRNEDCPLDDISPCKPADKNVLSRWSKLIAFNSNSDLLYKTNPEGFPLCEANVKNNDEALKLKCRIR